MCGIVGYIGNQKASNIIIKGLKRLEYRGYDSAGLSTMENNQIFTSKCKGKITDLESLPSIEEHINSFGIGHTRWATHGEPNIDNAHPHNDSDNIFSLIHNGIIENHYSIKEYLISKGIKFKSDTDTEVLVQFISYIYKKEKLDFYNTVKAVLKEVKGTYGIVVMCKDEPQKLVAAKNGSPLLIGIGKDENFLASDASAILDETRNIFYLDDGEIAEVTKNTYKVTHIEHNQEIIKDIKEIEFSLDQIEKGNFKHFMLKEIYEQPKAIRDTLRGRLLVNEGIISMSGIKEYEAKLTSASRIVIVACGTSWHAGMVAEYLFEELARVPVEVEYASEFRYRNPIINESDVVIAISQSGETADTLAAIELAKSKGATIFGICNVVGSSIARATHSGAYTHAGPEIGVASTKAFTAQVTVLTLIALQLGRKRGVLSESVFRQLSQELAAIPNKIEYMLKTDDDIIEISNTFKDVRNFLYLGRGYNFPVALEGALKLKEISYIHAEGYPAAEMKHGPIALIDENMPVVVIATKKGHYEKVVSNVQEIKARNGRIIAVVNEGDEVIEEMAEWVIRIPETEEAFTPLLTTIPLQLLSYHIAVMRGCNVDQPRNLAKSVTVE